MKPAHSQKLFEATGTEKPDKTLELFPGDHNSGRSRDFYTKASTQALVGDLCLRCGLPQCAAARCIGHAGQLHCRAC